MRRAKEIDAVRHLVRAKQGLVLSSMPFADGSVIDLAGRCSVIGGLNGAGKSRALRRLAEELGNSAVLIDLHKLSGQVLDLISQRADVEAMADEFGSKEILGERLDDLSRIVGRAYESVEWFSLEIEPADRLLADQYRWGGPQSLVPYFKAAARGREYDSLGMGLGELSVHLLFWVVEQYRESDPIVLLLDEPDAFLPPVGVFALLARLSAICLQRGWSIVLSTHSEELVRAALEHEVFTYLRAGDDGETVAIHSKADPLVAETLLARPPVDLVVVCEDETASHLAQAMLNRTDPVARSRATFVWGGGKSALTATNENLPRPPKPDIRFVFAYDGDAQKDKIGTANWPAVFLPGDCHPDELLMELADHVETLAQRFGEPAERLTRLIESLDGKNSHDWVNDLCAFVGRQVGLTQLCRLWAELHPEESVAFASSLH